MIRIRCLVPLLVAEFIVWLGFGALLPVLPLFGRGAVRLQPVYVADTARAVAQALGDPAAPGPPVARGAAAGEHVPAPPPRSRSLRGSGGGPGGCAAGRRPARRGGGPAPRGGRRAAPVRAWPEARPPQSAAACR